MVVKEECGGIKADARGEKGGSLDLCFIKEAVLRN